MLLDQAILSKILMQQAEKDSLPVTDDEVDAELDLRVREFVRMYGSEKAVEELAGKSIYQIKEEVDSPSFPTVVSCILRTTCSSFDFF